MSPSLAHLSLPKLGERANGDAVLVRGAGDRLLLGVIDGLGHGPIAAEAAHAALAALESAQLDAPVLDLMHALHERLRGTRGAAATLCTIRGSRLEACAVGNVQLASVKVSIPLILSSGVLGSHVSRFRVCQAELGAAARIALYSDGISSKFRLDEGRALGPHDAVKLAMYRHRKQEDDATILIADVGA